MRGELRVVGIGDPDRDDGAGAAVAARCGGRIVGDASFDGCWELDDDVVVVDTMVSGAPPGTVRWLAALEARTRHGVAEALAAVAGAGRLPARLRVVGIEAAGAAPVAGVLSPPVRLAVEELERVLGPD
jgi:Ni,Fe-hydrogenase maturation factor